MRHLIFTAILLVCATMHMSGINPDIGKFAVEDTTPNDSLLITEVKTTAGGNGGWCFIELTNMGSDTMDLWRFNIHTGGTDGHHLGIQPPDAHIRASLSGKLAPGKSYVFVAPKITFAVNPDGSYTYPNNFYANAELMEKADTVFRKSFDYFTTYSAYSIWFNPGDSAEGDSYLVDIWNYGQNSGNTIGSRNLPIAGNPEGATSMIYARKHLIKKGVDYVTKTWDTSRGDDVRNSEWIPIPQNMMFGYDEKPFTSIGSHANSSLLDVTSSVATIDVTNKVIEFPFGYRRDSLLRYFNIGPDHAWNFKNNGDTAQYFLQNHDTLYFYVLGDTLTTYAFDIKVAERPNTFNEISPLIYKNSTGNFTRKYSVSKGFPTDTIGGVAFDERVDTLLKYIVVEPGSQAEMVWVDGNARPDLKYGDILRVKASDGSTIKDYLIAVSEYYPLHESRIRNIIFPGLYLWENEIFEYTDTMLNFAPTTNDYFVTIPSDVEISPSVVAVPWDKNATVSVKRAENLKGDEANRTLTVTCTAEDDTSVTVYNFTFIVEREAPELVSSPFISDVGWNSGGQNHSMMQIFNPNNQTVDFSDYIIVLGRPNFTTAEGFALQMQTLATVNNRVLRPGYKPRQDVNGIYWELDPSQGTRNFVGPLGVYKIASNASYPFNAGVDPALQQLINFEAAKNLAVPRYGHTKMFSDLSLPANTLPMVGGYYAVLKITEDSVLEGTKPVHNYSSYEMLDVMGAFSSSLSSWDAWDNENGKDTCYQVSRYQDGGYWVRKPWVYRGNPIDANSFGFGTIDEVTKAKTLYTNGEWVVGGRNADLTTNTNLSKEIAIQRYNNHIMETYVNVPYVLSNVYLVEPGIEGLKDIFGISPNTTVQNFASNLILLDTNMVIKVKDAQGTLKMNSENVVQGDVLTSINGLGQDSVMYTLNIGALSTDVSLTSTVYTVVNNGAVGEINGIPVGSTIEDVLDKVVKPAHATVIVSNGAQKNISLTTLPNDTNKVNAGERSATLVDNSTYFEVVAQDGIAKRVYKLNLSATSPTIYSAVYVVSQDQKLIDYVSDNTVTATFIRNLIVKEGVQVRIYDKGGNLRTKGFVRYDDRVFAVAADKSDSVMYNVKFTNEPGIGAGIEQSIKKVNVSADMLPYPNPASSVVYLPSNALSVRVYDLAGQSKIVRKLNATPSIDVSKLPAGVYILKIELKNGIVYTAKLAKE